MNRESDLLNAYRLQLLFLLCYDVYALSAPHFVRTPMQFAAAMLPGLVLDIVLNWRRAGTMSFPIGGAITCQSVLLLCDSPRVWPYAFVALVSIASKHVIRFNGRNVFNPSNFGIVLGLLFFSSDITVIVGRWGGYFWLLLPIFCLGAATARKAGRLDLCAAYVATFLVGAGARSLINGSRLVTALAPATGAAFFLFLFHMISDPATTPATRRGRITFAVILGALDACLRQARVRHAPLLALFVLTALMPLLGRAIEGDIFKFRGRLGFAKTDPDRDA